MKCGPFHTRFSTCVKALHLRLFVQFQKMSEVGICGDALQLVGHDPSDILLDPVVVFLYHFLHVIHPFTVHEAGDNGYLLICLFLFGYFLGIDDNLAVEDFLFNPLPAFEIYKLGTILLNRKSKKNKALYTNIQYITNTHLVNPI